MISSWRPRISPWLGNWDATSREAQQEQNQTKATTKSPQSLSCWSLEKPVPGSPRTLSPWPVLSFCFPVIFSPPTAMAASSLWLVRRWERPGMRNPEPTASHPHPHSLFQKKEKQQESRRELHFIIENKNKNKNPGNWEGRRHGGKRVEVPHDSPHTLAIQFNCEPPGGTELNN